MLVRESLKLSSLDSHGGVGLCFLMVMCSAGESLHSLALCHKNASKQLGGEHPADQTRCQINQVRHCGHCDWCWTESRI